LGKLTIDKDENWIKKGFEGALESNVIEKDLLDEEVIFIEKLLTFILQRAMKFKEIALDMH